ncbi:MAG: hypothetical protein MPL62_08475 [Alphaproteobacteria bacterium]|nr:hypothetical protein [Alphaproteobacteria bacterium]
MSRASDPPDRGTFKYVFDSLKKTSNSWVVRKYKKHGEAVEIRDQNNNLILVRVVGRHPTRLPASLLDGVENGYVRVIIDVAPLGGSRCTGDMLKKCLRAVLHTPDRYPVSGYLDVSLSDIAHTVMAAAVFYSKKEKTLRPIHSTMNAVKDIIQGTTDAQKNKIVRILGVGKTTCKQKDTTKSTKPKKTPEVQEKEAEGIPTNADIQAWNMAGLMLSNATVFYDLIADRITLTNGEACKTLDEMRSAGNRITKQDLLDAWNAILGHNYGPIFEVARDLLTVFDGETAKVVIEHMFDTAVAMRSNKFTGSSTVYGELLQKTISDRTKLATYYTRPEAAMLMSAVAVEDPGSRIYAENAIRNIQIADFACGTGLLLSSAYKQLLLNYEISGVGRGQMPANVLHRFMMENCLIGLDVVPIATHLAVSALAMTYPAEIFGPTKVKKMPIGWQDTVKKTVRRRTKNPKRGAKTELVEEDAHIYRLGSLDLIKKREMASLVPEYNPVSGTPVRDPMWSVGQSHENVPDGSCDLIVMNPPFTSNRNRGKKHDGALAPGWAAFGADKEDQIEMGKLATRLFADTCAHDHAGKSTHFMAICDKKVACDGLVSLIIPATVSAGWSWSKMRALLNRSYEITVISIAAPRIKVKERSFSSDTGMGEVMIFARKTPRPSGRGTFISIKRRPESVYEALYLGKAIKSLGRIRKLESGKGGTPISIGGRLVGHALDCPLDDEWKYVNVYDPRTEQAAYSASAGHDSLISHFKIGIHSDLVIGVSNHGPFSKKAIDESSPKYPALWNSDQRNQLKMITPPDCRLIPRPKEGKRCRKMWDDNASRVHINLNPDYTSNSLVACYTSHPCIGGRVWPSVMVPEDYEKAFVLWCNSTLGILSYWSSAGKQQLGRGSASRNSVSSILIPDFSAMEKVDLRRLAVAFDRYADNDLDRIKNLWKDGARMSIDGVVDGVLKSGIDLERIRLLLCMEPSIGGGRPGQDLLEEYRRVIEC